MEQKKQTSRRGHVTRTFGGRVVGHEPVLWPPSRTVADNLLALQGIGQLKNSFPLAQTTSDITAATATGTGGTGGGPIYQEFYGIVLGLTGSATQAQTISVAICAAFASAYSPVFADLSSQDESLRQTLNQIILALQI